MQNYELDLRTELAKLAQRRQQFNNDKIIMSDYEKIRYGTELDNYSQKLGGIAIRQASTRWNRAIRDFAEAEEKMQIAQAKALNLSSNSMAHMEQAKMEVSTAQNIEDLEQLWGRTKNMDREAILARSSAIMKKSLDLRDNLNSGMDSRRKANSLFSEVKNAQDRVRYDTIDVKNASARLDKASREIFALRPLVIDVAKTFNSHELAEQIQRVEIQRKVDSDNPMNLIESVRIAPPKTKNENVKSVGGGNLSSGKHTTID